MSEAAPLVVRLFRDQKPVHETHLSTRLEFGRQRKDEPAPYGEFATAEGARIVVERWHEAYLSRKHCVLELLAGESVAVTNASGHNPILFEARSDALAGYFGEGGLVREVATNFFIEPTQQVKLTPPFLIAMGATTVYVEPPHGARPESGPVKLVGMERPVAPPSEELASLNQFSDLLAGHVDSGDRRTVLGWLEKTMAIFRRSATSADFLPQAAEAVVDTVGLDVAAILLRVDGEWKIETVVSSDAAGEASWRPSQTILNRVLAEKRTFRQLPADTDGAPASLQDVSALVAAPILDVGGGVLGVLYGDRRQRGASPHAAEVTELEAKLVELLTSAVAAGLARLEQEKIALASRVQFEQFFTPELSRELQDDPELLKGRDAKVTLLFGDIRGFSRISERMGPESTVAWINSVLGAFSERVAEQAGVLIDYVGDELFAMWGAPAECRDQASRACRTALSMQACLSEIDRQWEAKTGEKIGFGVGVNTGVARVGNVGSHKKFKYGPLGNAVNSASRLQGATKHLRTPILVAGPTAAELDPSEFALRRLGKIRVVNIQEPLDAFELAPAASPEWVGLKQEYEQALDAFEQGDFFAAAKLLGGAVTRYPDDGPSILLLSRTVERIASDGGEAFDPVWELSSK